MGDVRFMGGRLPGESFVLLFETPEEKNTNPLKPVTLTHKQDQSRQARWELVLLPVNVCVLISNNNAAV